MSELQKFTKILFLCVANSARSQMAEFIAKKILPNNIEIKSAGSNPGAFVHPVAVQTMNDFNAEIIEARPKSIDSLPEGFLSDSCLVVRLCAEEECPLVSKNIEVRDWSLQDPAQPAHSANPNEDITLAFSKTKHVLLERIYELKEEFFREV